MNKANCEAESRRAVAWVRSVVPCSPKAPTPRCGRISPPGTTTACRSLKRQARRPVTPKHAVSLLHPRVFPSRISTGGSHRHQDPEPVRRVRTPAVSAAPPLKVDPPNPDRDTRSKAGSAPILASEHRQLSGAGSGGRDWDLAAPLGSKGLDPRHPPRRTCLNGAPLLARPPASGARGLGPDRPPWPTPAPGLCSDVRSCHAPSRTDRRSTSETLGHERPVLLEPTGDARRGRRGGQTRGGS